MCVPSFSLLRRQDSRSTLNIAVYCRGRAGDKVRGGWWRWRWWWRVVALPLSGRTNGYTYRHTGSCIWRVAQTDI